MARPKLLVVLIGLLVSLSSSVSLRIMRFSDN